MGLVLCLLSPLTISLRDLSVSHGILWGWQKPYGPFLPAVYHPFVLREAEWALQQGYPSMAYQRSRRSLRELCGVTADLSRTGDRILSPAGSRMPVETPSQRDPAAAPEERGAVILRVLLL